MTNYFTLEQVTKQFRGKTALDRVSVSATEPSIIGLVGKNGSGKTTLMRHLVGLYLPTEGRSTTLGCNSADIGPRELARIGMVHQDDQLIPRMTATQMLRFVGGFYDRWDRDLERMLVATLEIDPDALVATMSPGTRQKLALVAATCHHPSLLILDEPLSDLDPIVRGEVVAALLERFGEDEMVMLVSSHMLHDVERIADRIVCLDGGRVVADAPLDALRESYAEWHLFSREGALPSRFAEPYVLAQEGDRWQMRVVVENPRRHEAEFRARYGVDVDSRTMNLERVFRVLVDRDTPRLVPRTVDEGVKQASGSGR
jgi:ABC-2 type transport system ATP-binding protein